MATTTYKGAYLPTVSGDVGTWGTLLNTTTFPVFDTNLGGIVSKTLSSSDVILNASESQNAIVRLTGTLSASVQVTTSCKGFHFVENLCTLGGYTVTITNGVSGVSVPYGRHVLIFDGTNGSRISGSDSFVTGTKMLFQQTSAPTGWTKATGDDDKALRVVSGTVGSGGSTAFSSIFAARTIDVTNLPVSSPWSISDPGHTHTTNAMTQSGSGTPCYYGTNIAFVSATINSATTGITLGSNSGGGQTIDFAVQYIDVIVATKD